MSMDSSDYLDEMRWRIVFAHEKAAQGQYEFALVLLEQMQEYLPKAERALRREIKYKQEVEWQR